MKLIYGLGNPGRRYEYTRHNIGFLVADFLASKMGIPLKKAGSDMVCGKGVFRRVPVMIAKPQTFMNLSGTPLKNMSLDPEDFIVIHDDMDLPAGTVRVKFGGGTGGHKGLDSIVDSFGGGMFIRIRCGIGRPEDGCDPSDYVLGLCPEQDLPSVRKQIEDAASAVEICLREGHVRAMNLFNRRPRDPSGSDAGDSKAPKGPERDPDQ